jgi:hypothetical protein
MNFSNQRFVDLGQTLFIEWSKNAQGLSTVTEQERREIFFMAAQYAFEAAEEFAKVFRDQESN